MDVRGGGERGGGRLGGDKVFMGRMEGIMIWGEWRGFGYCWGKGGVWMFWAEWRG